MPKFKIVTDSAGQLTADQITRYNIYVIDLPVTVNGNLYGRVSTINPEAYLRLLGSSNKPNIEFISPTDLAQIYDELASDGSEIISIHLSSRLINTFEVAQQAAEIASATVHVVDSQMASIGLAYQTLAAAKDVEAGKDFEEIKQHLARVLSHTHSFSSIIDNKQLITNKVINRFMGSIEDRLNIRYILEFKDNEFKMLRRTPDMSWVADFWDEQFKFMQQHEILDINIVHANDDRRAKQVLDTVQAQFPDIKINFSIVNPVIANIVGTEAINFTYLTS